MFTAASQYGCAPVAPSYGVAAPTERMATDDIRTGVRGLLDPANPLVWLGGILLVTIGAIGISGSVRVGKAKASAAVGSA